MDHLIGSDTLKPYMHGFFVDLRLYTKARAIANPFAYAEYRDRLIREKLEKERESRIRGASNNKRIAQLEKQAKESAKLVEKAKVNKELAERIRIKEEKEEKLRIRREEYKKAKEAAKNGGEAVQDGVSDEEDERVEESEADSDEEATAIDQKKPSILRDDRFKDLFTNPDFEVDEDSLEFAMLNPSSASTSKRPKDKQAIERMRASDLMGDDVEEDDLDEDDLEASSDRGDSDSSDEGDLGQYDPRMGKSAARMPRGEVDARTGKRKAPNQMREIEAVRAARKAKKDGRYDNAAAAAATSRRPRLVVEGEEAENTTRTLGQRLHGQGQSSKKDGRQGRTTMRGSQGTGSESARALPGGGMEFTFVPTTTEAQDARDERRALLKAKGKANPEDTSVTERQAKATLKAGRFGAGLEKADSAAMINARANLSMNEDERSGRKGMRRDIRSASKNRTRYL